MSRDKQVGDGGTNPGTAPRPDVGNGDALDDRDRAEGGNGLGYDALTDGERLRAKLEALFLAAALEDE